VCGAPCAIKRVGPNTSASATDAAGLKSAADDKEKNADNMTNNEANISRRARFAHQSFVSDHWHTNQRETKDSEFLISRPSVWLDFVDLSIEITCVV